jgi:hypothetical protein
MIFILGKTEWNHHFVINLVLMHRSCLKGYLYLDGFKCRQNGAHTAVFQSSKAGKKIDRSW